MTLAKPLAGRCPWNVVKGKHQAFPFACEAIGAKLQAAMWPRSILSLKTVSLMFCEALGLRGTKFQRESQR